MDFEDLIKRIEKQEDEIRSQAKSISVLIKKNTSIDRKIATYLKTIRDLRKEIKRINAVTANLGGFDIALAQIRKDFNEKLDVIEKQRQSQQNQREVIQQSELKSIKQAIADSNKKNSAEIDKSTANFIEMNSRLVKKVEEIDRQINEKLRVAEELNKEAKLLSKNCLGNARRLENFQVEFEAVKKGQEENKNKMSVVLERLRKNDDRINDLYATESERRKAQITFDEQQAILQHEQQKTWKSWQAQIENIPQKTSSLFMSIKGKEKDLNRIQDSFEEITKKFERRMSELTKLHRLFEERFNKDWAIFKADTEKKWLNYSLIFGEKQEDFVKQFEDFKKNLIKVEDSNKELKNLFMLMSNEMQKGMHNLMKMFDGWIDAFEHMRDKD